MLIKLCALTFLYVLQKTGSGESVYLALDFIELIIYPFSWRMYFNKVGKKLTPQQGLLTAFAINVVYQKTTIESSNIIASLPPSNDISNLNQLLLYEFFPPSLNCGSVVKILKVIFAFAL